MDEQGTIAHWTEHFESMREEMAGLKSAGRWRSGPRTLLRQLEVHHNEVILCRALSWILTPDAWHTLGDRFLRRFLLHLGLSAEHADHARISIEEVRGPTRADIVIRTGDATVVIEAKVLAPESERQCDRLAEAWQDESPTFVFLSPAGLPPTSATNSQDEWSAMSWREVADLAESALGQDSPPDTGELDFIRTIEIYGV